MAILALNSLVAWLAPFCTFMEISADSISDLNSVKTFMQTITNTAGQMVSAQNLPGIPNAALLTGPNTIFETIGDEIVALATASSNLAISGIMANADCLSTLQAFQNLVTTNTAQLAGFYNIACLPNMAADRVRYVPAIQCLQDAWDKAIVGYSALLRQKCPAQVDAVNSAAATNDGNFSKAILQYYGVCSSVTLSV